MFNSGFIESGYDPNDIILDTQYENTENLPLEYDYSVYQKLTPKDQGQTSQCVPYSLAVVLESRKLLNNKTNFKLNIQDIYNARKDQLDGMTIREALEYMKTIGFEDITTNTREQILLFGKLTSIQAIKSSIYMNGPCVIGLPVYDSMRTDFWKGNTLEGGHAIACVGYDKEGLKLLNSWGKNWGYFGMCTLPYNEINGILECWTLIEK